MEHFRALLIFAILSFYNLLFGVYKGNPMEFSQQDLGKQQDAPQRDGSTFELHLFISIG